VSLAEMYPETHAQTHMGTPLVRDYKLCDACGGFRMRDFNCDDPECESRTYQHFHTEPCRECEVE
jgi:hypothetical protein